MNPHPVLGGTVTLGFPFPGEEGVPVDVPEMLATDEDQQRRRVLS
jgi:hypothetical protein